jgi:hypothetical protein
LRTSLRTWTDESHDRRRRQHGAASVREPLPAGMTWRCREQGAAMIDNAPRQPVRFLVFSASLSSGSLNTRLAGLAAETIEANDGTVADRGAGESYSPRGRS